MTYRIIRTTKNGDYEIAHGLDRETAELFMEDARRYLGGMGWSYRMEEEM